MKIETMSILYENDDVVVIHKPPGIMVHHDGYHDDEETVVDWFLQHVPESKGVGEVQTLKDGSPVDRSGIVHRLDKETSGALMLAKTQPAFDHLKKQFQDRMVKKEYRAFVYGTMREAWGTIDRSIGRSAKDFRLRSAQRGAKGTLREAVTKWERIGQNLEYAYLRLMPLTGRTHQIRVHLKAIGRPVLGDLLYAPANLLEKENLGLKRLALHAHTIELILPDGETQRFIAPLPQEFENAAEQMAEQ